MEENRLHDYTEHKNEGHIDTREANFEGEKPDKNWDVTWELIWQDN